MKKQLRDLLQVITESYTISKNLQNQIKSYKQQFLEIQLEKSDQKNQINQMAVQLKQQNDKIYSLHEEIKFINEKLDNQNQKNEIINNQLDQFVEQEEKGEGEIQLFLKAKKENAEVQRKHIYQDFRTQIEKKMKKFRQEQQKQITGFRENSNIVVLAEEDAVIRQFFGPQKIIDPLKSRLLYRASDNEFSAHKFHEKCDGIKNTLVLVETQFNKKIGGFTPLTWQNFAGDDFNKKADNLCLTFLFSLTNQDKFTLSPYHKDCAIKNKKGYGPMFGADDLTILAGADKGQYSMINIGYAYQNRNYIYKEKESWMYFSGNPSNSNRFKILQWEVWEVVFKQ